LKNSITISFLILLLTAQYARQLSYMGCTLYNQLQANASYSCDCERILNQEAPTATDYESTTTTHRHLHVEDYTHTVLNEWASFPKATTMPILYGQYGERLTIGFLRKPIKPPQV
jgi:hypothetical protein